VRELLAYGTSAPIELRERLACLLKAARADQPMRRFGNPGADQQAQSRRQQPDREHAAPANIGLGLLPEQGPQNEPAGNIVVVTPVIQPRFEAGTNSGNVILCRPTRYMYCGPFLANRAYE
jgi:hypothetical protein